MSEESKNLQSSRHEQAAPSHSSDRRQALKKLLGGSTAGLVALHHIPVMAASSCTASGHISAATNASGKARHYRDHCDALSPGAWSKPYNGAKCNSDGELLDTSSSGDGNVDKWLLLGVAPNRPGNDEPNFQKHWDVNFAPLNNGAPHSFKDIFEKASYPGSMEDAIDNSIRPKASNLDRFAANAFMSVSWMYYNGMGEGLISPNEIQGLYNAHVSGGIFISNSGNIVEFEDDETLRAFFEGLIH